MAGCVFAEDEAAVLLASARTPLELEQMVQQRVAGAQPCQDCLSARPGISTLTPVPIQDRSVHSDPCF